MRVSINRLLVAILIGVLSVPGAMHAGSAAEVVGTTYTSPTFGYTVSWESPWIFIQEAIEAGYDALILGSGMTGAQVNGGPQQGSASEELTASLFAVGASPDVSEVAPMLDESGSPIRHDSETEAYAVYSYVYEYAPGSVAELVGYIAIVDIGQGLSAAVLVEGSPEEYEATNGFV